MRLLGTLLGSFAVSFLVGWVFGFTYQTDWIAGLILFAGIYISFQVDELYMLVVESVPGALEHARLPQWMKKRLSASSGEGN